MRAATVARAVRDLFLVNGWTTGVMATTREGFECSPWSPQAAAFCVSGAAQRVTNDEEERRSFYASLRQENGDAPVTVWNDLIVTSKAELLETLDRVVERVLHYNPTHLQPVDSRRK